MLKEILEKFNNFAIFGTIVLIFLCIVFYNILFAAGNPERRSELRLYDVLVFIILSVVVVNIVLLLYSYISTKSKKGIFGSRGIKGPPGEKGEAGTCNSDCGKKVCIAIVLEESNKYLNTLLYKATSEYIPFSNYVEEKIKVVSHGDKIDEVLVDRKIRVPEKYNERALAIYSNDDLKLNQNDNIVFVDYGVHTVDDEFFPKTNIGSIKVRDNFYVKIKKTTGEEIVLNPGEYNRLDLDDKNLEKTDTISKITIETEIQNKFLINKLNKLCHSTNYQKMLERPGKRKINEKKLIEYITDITKKWIKELFYFKINLSKDGKTDTVFAGLRFLLEPNFKIDMFKNYKDNDGKIINNPFYVYEQSPNDDTKFIEKKGEILKYDIWNWSEQYYTNKPVITKCFNKKNLPKDEESPVSMMTTNDYIPKYTAETSVDLFSTTSCPYGQLNDEKGMPTNPRGKTHCVYVEPTVTYEINDKNESIQHVEHSKKIVKTWKDKKVYKPDNEVSLYHPKGFTDKQGRKFFPVGSVWTGVNDINKPKFSNHTPASDNSCSSHGKYGPRKETVLVSGDVKPPKSYRELWSSENIDTELKEDIKVKGGIFYKKPDQSGDSYALPNNKYTKLKFKQIVPHADSVVIKRDNLLKIDYIEDDGRKGFDEFVTGGHNFDNYRQYNKTNYKFQFIPVTAKVNERGFPPIKNGGEYHILSLNYNNSDFHFLRDVNGKGEITINPPHTPLEIYKHRGFEGTQSNFDIGPNYVGAQFDQASSFKLRKGYYAKFCDWKGGGHPNWNCSNHWHPSRSTEIRWVHGPRDVDWIEKVGLEDNNLDWVGIEKTPNLYFYGTVTDYTNMKMTVLYEDDIYFSIRSGNGRYLNLQNGVNFTTEKDILEFYEHSPGSILIRSTKYNKLLYFDENSLYSSKPFTPYVDLSTNIVLREIKKQYLYLYNDENHYLQDLGKSRDVMFLDEQTNPFQRLTVKYYKDDAFTIRGEKSFAFLTVNSEGKVQFLNEKVSDTNDPPELFKLYSDGEQPYKTDGIPKTETQIYILSVSTGKFLGIDSSGKLVLDKMSKYESKPFNCFIVEIDDSMQSSEYSNIKIWRPEPPTGYKCLGDVVTKLSEAPSTSSDNPTVVCVPETCVEEVPILNQFYNNKNMKVEINDMTSDGDVVVKKVNTQKPMELYSSGVTNAFEENRNRENQDYSDDGGHNLFRFSENGLPNKTLGLKINRTCLKNRKMKPIQPKNANNVLNMIDSERDDYKKTGGYFTYPLDAYIENRRVDEKNKIIKDNKSYYLQYATDKPLSFEQRQSNSEADKIDGAPKVRGDGVYFVKASGTERNEFDNCLIVENGKIKRTNICNMSDKNHLWELMDFEKFNFENNIDDDKDKTDKFSHKDKTSIELRNLGENKCLRQTYDEKGVINEALVQCKKPSVEDDKNKFSWMYRTIDSNDSFDSFEDAKN